MRIKPLSRNPDYAATKSGRVYSHKSGKWKALKPQKDTDGYLQVRLCNNGSSRLTFVHCLVAEEHIPNPNNYPEVNHKDGNKENNTVRNLEWSTRKDNMLHAHNSGLIKTRKPILATNLKTNEKKIFRGQREAARELNVNQGNINHALKRENGTAYGYKFEYARKEDNIENY